MDFPNGWLTIGVQVMLLIASTILQFAFTRNGPAGQNTIGYSLAFTLASMIVSAATFFALTGSFPWQLLAIGIPLALTGHCVVWLIFLAAGLQSPNRARDVFVLQSVFFRQRNVAAVLTIVYLSLILQFSLVFVAFQRAEASDVATADGLFEVGLWALSIPTAAVFLVGNLMRGLSLLSRETPRQARVHALAFAFSQFATTAWTVGYPWYAFRQEELVGQPLVILMAMVALIGLFLLFVIIPYYVGRTRFDVKKLHDLNILKTECARLEIATNGTISQKYKTELLSKSFRNLHALIKENAEGRPSLEEFHTRFSQLVEEIGKAPASPADQTRELEAEYDPPAEDTTEAEQSDPRMFVFVRANRLITSRHDLSTLRGIAFETALECDRWLAMRDGRTALLAIAGVIGTAIIPLAARLFENEIKNFTDKILTFVGIG